MQVLRGNSLRLSFSAVLALLRKHECQSARWVSACNFDGLYVPPTNEAVLKPLIDSMLESKNLDDSCKPSIAEPINDLACCLLPVKKNALALEHPLPW